MGVGRRLKGHVPMLYHMIESTVDLWIVPPLVPVPFVLVRGTARLVCRLVRCLAIEKWYLAVAPVELQLRLLLVVVRLLLPLLVLVLVSLLLLALGPLRTFCWCSQELLNQVGKGFWILLLKT